MQLLVPLPHPATQIRAVQTLLAKTQLVEHLRLVLPSLDSDVIDGFLQQLLSCSRIFGKNAAVKCDSGQVLPQVGEVERDLVLDFLRLLYDVNVNNIALRVVRDGKDRFL